MGSALEREKAMKQRLYDLFCWIAAYFLMWWWKKPVKNDESWIDDLERILRKG